MKKLLPVAALAFLTLCSSLVIATPIEILTSSQAEPSADFKEKLALGETYRDQGSYGLAEKEFKAVLAEAEKNGDSLTQAMAASALGYNYYLARNNNDALALLEQAKVLAKPLNSPDLSALIDDYLGMLYLTLQQPEKAASSFGNALKNAQLGKNEALIAGIRVNQAELESDASSRLGLLENITPEVLKLNDELIKIKLLLNISEQLLAIAPANLNDAQKQLLLKNTYQVINNTYQLSDLNNQVRLRSQAEGYLARLYAQQGLKQDALLWLDKAVFDAQQVKATDLLMQWEIQSAQLLHAGGNLEAASAAYKRAVKHVVDIRNGLPVNLHNGRSSIKEIIEPIYRGLADVLLLQAAKSPSNEAKQNLLKEAIDAMETIKQTELEDFFKDRCLIDEAASVNLKDALQPGVGIIYPIILPDRVELLFRAGDSAQFEQKIVAVELADVVKTTTEMAQYLRDGKGNYRNASHKLYDWLLRAYDATLKEKGITTIIFVPDGSLRQVPFAALLNGKKFAVEDYAIVTLPGLTLKKTVSSNDKKPRALIAALSKPDGASVDELLLDSAKDVFGERGMLTLSEPSPAKQTRAEKIEALSLPGVNDEILGLQKNIENTPLLNHDFTYEKFKESVGTGEYSIIHVASHGYFGKTAEDSFVMTYDRNLKLGEFQSLLSNENIKKNPIDLLTLSACQTAAGDDRALLGFSGIAIKTNALSAIGALWSVNDAATAKFMETFYAHLTKLPKALALQQAQLSLLKNNELRHPYYWSPFILVGNW